MLLIFFSFLYPILTSFLMCLSVRIKEGKNILGRSVCDNCKKTLNFFELIPIFNILFTKGKCSECNKRYSLVYTFLEVLNFLFAYLCLKQNISLKNFILFNIYFIIGTMNATLDYFYFLGLEFLNIVLLIILSLFLDCTQVKYFYILFLFLILFWSFFEIEFQDIVFFVASLIFIKIYNIEMLLYFISVLIFTLTYSLIKKTRKIPALFCLYGATILTFILNSVVLKLGGNIK